MSSIKETICLFRNFNREILMVQIIGNIELVIDVNREARAIRIRTNREDTIGMVLAINWALTLRRPND